jgi:hypothetical protein
MNGIQFICILSAEIEDCYPRTRNLQLIQLLLPIELLCNYLLQSYAGIINLTWIN